MRKGAMQMFRAIILSMVLISMISCKTQTDKLEDFDKYIGESNKLILDQMIGVFENEIGKLTDENPYKYFLATTIQDTLTRQDWFSQFSRFEDIRNEVQNSGFKDNFFIKPIHVIFDSGLLVRTYEYFDLYYNDTVTYSDSSFVNVELIDYKYKFLDSVPGYPDQIVEWNMLPKNSTYNDYIKQEMNSSVFNRNGRILKGIENYATDSLAIDYVENKYLSGFKILYRFADEMIYSKPDFNNDKVKIIILTELFGY
jgi:hypothetical protein